MKREILNGYSSNAFLSKVALFSVLAFLLTAFMHARCAAAESQSCVATFSGVVLRVSSSMLEVVKPSSGERRDFRLLPDTSIVTDNGGRYARPLSAGDKVTVYFEACAFLHFAANSVLVTSKHNASVAAGRSSSNRGGGGMRGGGMRAGSSDAGSGSHGSTNVGSGSPVSASAGCTDASGNPVDCSVNPSDATPQPTVTTTPSAANSPKAYVNAPARAIPVAYATASATPKLRVNAVHSPKPPLLASATARPVAYTTATPSPVALATALPIRSGYIAFRKPSDMTEFQAETFVLRVSARIRDLQQQSLPEFAHGSVQTATAPIGDSIKASLKAEPADFTVTPVSGAKVQGIPPVGFATWEWSVMPKRHGSNLQLHLYVSALIGATAYGSPEDYTFYVRADRPAEMRLFASQHIEWLWGIVPMGAVFGWLQSRRKQKRGPKGT